MSPKELFLKHLANVGKPSNELDLSIYDDDIECSFPYAPEGHTASLAGIERFTKFVTALGVFADERILTPLEVIESGSQVVGIFQSEFRVIETDRRCSMPMILVLDCSGDKIIKFQEFYDPVKVLKAFADGPFAEG